MDTRQLSGSMEIAEAPLADVVASDVEVVELSAVAERRRRSLVARIAFAVAVAFLAGLVAMAGLPHRTSFSLNNPLPNLLQPNAPR